MRIPLVVLFTFISVGAYCQVDSTKRSPLTINAGCCLFSCVEGSDYGGQLKVMKQLKPKFNIGLMVMPAQINSPSYTYPNGPYNPGYIEDYRNSLGLITDAIANYQLLGYNKTVGLYAEGGIGYQFFGQRQNLQFTSETTYPQYIPMVESFAYYSGLGIHLAIGANCKIGPGRLYLEVLAGYMIFGTNSVSWTDPPNFPTNVYGGEIAGYKNRTTGFAPNSYYLDAGSISIGYAITINRK